ncbi:acyl carrier protein [Pedosphaera parvula]|nr:phosphopantetheine-binding protein [Pedosphaera parvula]
MKDQNILDVVSASVRTTLGLRDNEPVRPDQLLFYDFAFTSMDMLDLMFRMEEHFKIMIPEETLYGLAKGDLAENEFANEGVLTTTGRERLMSLLHDSPREIFPERIHVKTFPRYCTVGAMVRLVEHQITIKEQVRCSS